MAQDLDDFPIYDAITKRGSAQLSNEWMTFLTMFKENLSGYLSSLGMFVPIVSTAQRNTIQSPQSGQIIFNSDLNKAQIFQSGAWSTFT